jgi:integrase
MPELRRWYLYQDDYASRYPKVREAKQDPDTDYVLMTMGGKKVPHSTMIRQLKRRAAKAGLHLNETTDRDNCSKVSPHTLRRTFASILLNDGHYLDAVADVLGHTSLNTTRKHYAFSSTERRKATIRGFNV